MKPAGLMIAVGAPKASAAKEDGESLDDKASDSPSASSALFTAKAKAVAKVIGLSKDKHEAFAAALKGAFDACSYDAEED